LFTKDCLGISGTTPSALASQVSTTLSQITSAAGDTTSLDVTIIFNSVTSALANVQGLSGNLLSTVITQVASAMALVNNPTEALPTAAPVSLLTIGNLRVAANPDDAESLVPIVTVHVHPLPGKQPSGGIVSAALSVFNGGSRGRRRVPERDGRVSLEDVIFCVENPDDESC
jgi:hypothetical protein